MKAIFSDNSSLGNVIDSVYRFYDSAFEAVVDISDKLANDGADIFKFNSWFIVYDSKSMEYYAAYNMSESAKDAFSLDSSRVFVDGKEVKLLDELLKYKNQEWWMFKV